MNVYVEPLTFVCVAPVNEILLIPILSLATAVNVTVLFWAVVVNSIESSVASLDKLVMVGSSSSTTESAMVSVSVSVLPAASLATTARLSLDEPKDKLS